MGIFQDKDMFYAVTITFISMFITIASAMFQGNRLARLEREVKTDAQSKAKSGGDKDKENSEE